MLNELFLRNTYLLFFIPIIASVIVNFMYEKRFMVGATKIIMISMIFLALRMLLKCSDFNTTYFIESNSKFNVLSTEFRINAKNLFFFISILVCNFIGFINYINTILLNKNLNNNNIKYFFAIYLIHLFSIVGIIFTCNILNLFIFLEIYSLSIYVTISIYKKNNLNIISYKFFTNNIFGSILSALAIFYIKIYFGTSNIIDIKQQMISLNIQEHYEVLLMSILFLFSIIIKFFLTNTSKYHNTDKVGVNFLSISNIFVNVAIGLYLIYEVIFFILGTKTLFSLNFIKYIIFAISTLIIVYNSVNFLIKKENSLFNIFIRFNLINFGYILFFILFYEKNNQLCINLLMLYLFEFVTINLIAYLISDIMNILYENNNINYINNNKLLRYTFLFLLLYKIFLPFGTSLYTNLNLISNIIKNKTFIYLLPYIVNKGCFTAFFVKTVNNNIIKEVENTEDINNKKRLNNLYFSVFFILGLMLIFELCFGRIIK